jgi:hypothetical protein
MIDRACQQLNDAIAIVPDEQMQAFLTAVRTCPHLVRTESEPVWFLRREGFNPWVSSLLTVLLCHACARSHATKRQRANHLTLSSFRIVQNAASRIICYWDVRRKLFGDRAHLPLVQTGHGVFTSEEVGLLMRHNPI